MVVRVDEIAVAAVMGMGVTGRAVAEALLRRGIEVLAFDDRPTDELLAWTASTGVEVRRPESLDLENALCPADVLLPAPGLPDHHVAFAAAERVGVTVMSEFDLAGAWDDRPTIAVTGTDGKTTVVTLVERMLNRSGLAAVAVGNTDTPWVQAIDEPSTDVFVVEASSFRLGHSRTFSPNVATWLNFGPDHLDAHRDLAAYEAAKASMWAHLGANATAIANRDDAVVGRHAALLADDQVETFGAGAPPRSVDHGIVDADLVVGGRRILPIAELQRALPHDLLNALAAAASAVHVGADPAAIAEVLREFDGLEHRVQLVADIDGVQFVNDSKATTPHASAAALGGFDSIVLIAGGKNKGLSFDDMLAHVGRLKHVVAVGDSAEDIERVFAPYVPTSRAASMTDAVDDAARQASPGDTVLLSPACASYDWYRSYIHRGQDFIRIVHARQTPEDPSS